MIQLSTPLVWLCLPLPWMIWRLMPPASLPPVLALPVPFLRLIQNTCPMTLETTQKGWRYFLIIWTLFLLALSGPEWLGEPVQQQETGRNIFLVLDVSGSMQVPDMIVNHRHYTRLDVVKYAAKQFVQAREQDHIGLILFGSEAYLQTPLTFDHQTILHHLEDASVGLAGNTTSLGDALTTATKHLKNTAKAGRIVILLTDGANNSGMLSPQKAAELAAAEHIKVYTIGLSADTRGGLPLSQLLMSMQNGNDLDEKTLKKIASITQGRYFRATDPSSLAQIYLTIDALETTSYDSPPLRPKLVLYPYCITLANLLLIGWLLLHASGRPRLLWRRQS